MSMDLEVWARRATGVSPLLEPLGAWVDYGGQFAHEADGWQVLVLPGEFIERGAPPPAVTERLSGACFRVEVQLEPIGADDEGYAFLERVIRHLAEALGGVWVDPSGQVFGPHEGSFS